MQWINKKRKDMRAKRVKDRGCRLAADLNVVDLAQEEAQKKAEQEEEEGFSKAKKLSSARTLSLKSDAELGKVKPVYQKYSRAIDQVGTRRSRFTKSGKVRGVDITDDLDEASLDGSLNEASDSFSIDQELPETGLPIYGGHLGQRKGMAGMNELMDESSTEEYADSFSLDSSSLQHGRAKRSSLRMTQEDMSQLPGLMEVVKAERVKEWAARFRRTDPRYQIMTYFDNAAMLGVDQIVEHGMVDVKKISPILKMFYRSAIFTVWRPTSMDAIRQMMKGQGVGKGLDIKGKSAIRGKLSGFVPFMQLYEERHKTQIRTLTKKSPMRIFFKTQELRDSAAEQLAEVGEEMLDGWESAQEILANEEVDDAAQEKAMEKYMWDMDEPEIILLNEYAENVQAIFGVEIPERLFWEAFVMRRDTSREKGSKNDTGRPSHPVFQDMNFATLRNPEPGRPRPVVFQQDADEPMDARNLVVAYEENDKVLPVVSDFDCFTVGTRAVSFDDAIPEDQLKLVDWSVSKIETILDAPPSSDSWTERWLKVLKDNPIKPEMPAYGFGDPKSYSLMELAVNRLKKDGCVRHGAECFNYYFPQMLDDHFLVIGEGINTNDKGSPWKYVSAEELQKILKEKIKEGFTFPLNPKWILCDPGWKEVYDALLNTKTDNVQNSMKCWYPPESGIREKIEEISKKHPRGFVRMLSDESNEHRKSNLLEFGDQEECDGTAAMDLAQQQLKSYETLQSAKLKLRVVLIWMSFVRHRREEKKERDASKQGEVVADEATISARDSMQRSLRENMKAGFKPQQLKIRASMRSDNVTLPKLLDRLQKHKSFAAKTTPQVQVPTLKHKSSLPAGKVAASVRGRHAGSFVRLPTFEESMRDMDQSLSNMGHSNQSLESFSSRSHGSDGSLLDKNSPSTRRGRGLLKNQDVSLEALQRAGSNASESH